MVSSWFLVGLQPVDCKGATLVKGEFLRISRMLLFWMYQRTWKSFRSAEISPVTLLKFNHRHSAKIFSEASIGNICGGISFQYNYPWFQTWISGNLSWVFILHNTQEDMLQKIINCESLENSQENIYDGSYSGKVASLQRTDCNSTISRLQHRFFLEYISKSTWHKKNILEKSLWCTSVSIKDTHREKAPSKKTQALSKSMNMDIWVLDSNELFIRGS